METSQLLQETMYNLNMIISVLHSNNFVYIYIYIFNNSIFQFQTQKECKHPIVLLLINMIVIPAGRTWSWDGDLIDRIMHYNTHLRVITCWKQYKCMNESLHSLVLSASDSDPLNRTQVSLPLTYLTVQSRHTCSCSPRQRTKEYTTQHHHRVTTQWCHQYSWSFIWWGNIRFYI